jgi:predicted transcriptional regulator of viral defense system
MQRLTEAAMLHSPTGVFTRAEVAAWLRGSADAEAALVKRALAAGEVIRICRGLYCLDARYRDRPVDSLAIAQLMMGPSYVSLEAALAFHGWLPEAVETVTSVCAARSRRFQTPIGSFRFDRVPQRELLAAVARVSRGDRQAAFIATPLKALADYVSVHRADWNGIEPLIDSLRIPPECIAEIQPEQCTTLAANYRSRRVRRFLTGLGREAAKCRSH